MTSKLVPLEAVKKEIKEWSNENAGGMIWKYRMDELLSRISKLGEAKKK